MAFLAMERAHHHRDYELAYVAKVGVELHAGAVQRGALWKRLEVRSCCGA